VARGFCLRTVEPLGVVIREREWFRRAAVYKVAVHGAVDSVLTLCAALAWT